MVKAMDGKKVIIAGSRKLEEMGSLIERQGGQAEVRSLQGISMFREQEMEQELRRFIEEQPEWVIFTTGIGASALFEAAERLGIGEAFTAAVRQASIAIRGYKTYNTLKTRELAPDVRDSDGTVKGLEEQLQQVNLEGSQIWVQLHGDPAPELVAFLEGKGAASVHTMLPYQNLGPEPETLAQLRQEIADSKVDAICFTTAVQVRNLFADAAEHGYTDLLKEALSSRILAVSVGKVTSEALRQEGIERIIAPDNERMGAMIIEMNKYYEQQSSHHETE